MGEKGISKGEVAISVSNEENAAVSANKPPKVPNAGNEPQLLLTRRRSLAKPKSRFGEQRPYFIEYDKMEETNPTDQEHVGGGSNSPYRALRADSAVSKTYSMTSNAENEHDEIIKKVRLHKEKLKGVKPKVVIELFVFMFLLGCLIASLSLDELERTHIWGLHVWKWCVLVMVIFCGLLVTNRFMHLVVFLIEFGSCYLGSFVPWRREIEDRNGNPQRIQESVFHHYILRTLSGPPFMEIDGFRRSPTHLTVGKPKKGKGSKVKKVIDMGKVHKLKRESFIMAHEGDREITNEEEAQYVAHQVFSNVARHDNNHNRRYIDGDDLLRFMIKEEVDHVFPLFEGSNTGKIDRKSFTNWVIKVFQDRKTLADALSDTKTAVKQLNKLVTVILIIVTIVIWVLLMEIATTKVLFLLSSQLVVAVFMFGNTCKTMFEAIIFVFVMHPFDVGDRCVVDGVQLLVEEMNILTTVFLKLDNEKVYYPNSVLATKPISNYYRSPDMAELIEFSIDFTTPAKTIGRLKEEIKM
ncbi:Mechanosensitive ion channel protein 10 [Hibiscus syriacus]|uniref:Mechanosensitive ion channel protein 10 n=1 Tax=Hibiscus syriacus TaxID=106335 RepID=A0A6A2Z853_HIBSY|nr:Mechanosensitive ion channel protein 10 [Hibiscus syriacus]